MSSVCSNWSKSDAPPGEVYRGNHQWLKEQLTYVVNEIKEKEEYLRIMAKIELTLSKKLQKKLNEVMRKHTRRMFDSADYMQKHDSMVNDFNTVALDIKYQIEEINQAISHEKLLERLQKFREMIRKLPQETVLMESYNKLLALEKKLQETDSLVNKEKSFEYLKEQIKEYELRYEEEQVKKTVTQTMDALNLEEDRAKITISSQEIKKEQLKTKIITYYDKIKLYSADRYADYKAKEEVFNDTSLEKLRILLSSVKLEYGELKSKAIWLKIYKDELGLLKERLGEKNTMNSVWIDRIDQVLSQSSIEKSEYQALEKEVMEYVRQYPEHQKLAQKLQENLEALGYHVQNDLAPDTQAKLQSGEVVYMDTDNDEYKIMVKLGSKQDFSIRFVRMVRSQSEKEQISTYQKQKDVEYAQKWCSDFDRLQNLLQQNQIIVGEKLRIEPEDSEVMYIVGTNLAKKRTKKHKVQQQNNLERQVR